MEWQWHQLDHMQIIFAPRCRYMTTPAPHQSIYRPDALHDALPTVSKHWTEDMSCYTELSIHLWCNWGGPIGVVKPDQPAGNRRCMAFMRERAKQFCCTEMSDIKLDSDALRYSCQPRDWLSCHISMVVDSVLRREVFEVLPLNKLAGPHAERDRHNV